MKPTSVQHHNSTFDVCTMSIQHQTIQCTASKQYFWHLYNVNTSNQPVYSPNTVLWHLCNVNTTSNQLVYSITTVLWCLYNVNTTSNQPVYSITTVLWCLYNVNTTSNQPVYSTKTVLWCLYNVNTTHQYSTLMSVQRQYNIKPTSVQHHNSTFDVCTMSIQH
jgi:hypothetical protein